MISKANFQQRLALVGILALAIGACTAPQPRPDEIALRVEQRWERLAARDLAGAYEYLSPGYRSSVSLNTYMSSLVSQKVRWTGGRYVSSECTANACQVRVDIDYLVVAPVPGVPKYEGTRTGAIENWVKSDGQWWHLPEK